MAIPPLDWLIAATGKCPASNVSAKAAPSTKPASSAKGKKCKQLAKDYLTGKVQESCLSFWMVLEPKSNISSNEIALFKLGDLVRTLQVTDPKIAILPWYINDRASLPPLTDYTALSLMEHSKFRTKFAHQFNSKFNQASWFNLLMASL